MKKIVIKKVLAGFLLLGITQSCKLTKDYKRPELNLPTAYENTLITNTSANENIVEIPSYQQFFYDPILIEILDQVMANNPDLNSASERVLASEALLKSVKLNYLPELNLQVTASTQRFSENSTIGTTTSNLSQNEFNLAPTVSWEIDFWGKLKRQREEALTTYLSQEENCRALRIQLITQAAQAYYNLLSLDAQLRITQDVEKSMQETLMMLQVQHAVGDVSSLAIKQAEAQLAEARALIPEIKGSIKGQENALQTLAGSYPASVNRVSSLTTSNFSTSVEIGVPADLLKNRPDVKQQELLLQAANARVGIAKAQFYPNLTITGQGGLNALKASDWFSIPASLFGITTGGITQPLFNKRRIKSNYQQALHLREAAVHEFRKSVVVALEEVSTSLSNISYIKDQVLEVNKRKMSMDKAIIDAQMLYQYGEANYLEVLTVQQSYFQTELAHIIAMQKEVNAYLVLYKSLGGN